MYRPVLMEVGSTCDVTLFFLSAQLSLLLCSTSYLKRGLGHCEAVMEDSEGKALDI